MELLHGIDIVELTKFRAVLSRHPSFAGEVFTSGERVYCEARSDVLLHFAGRFAAKEATLKALGLGLRIGIDRTLQDIEVIRAASGRPRLRLTGWPARLCAARGLSQIVLSISHTAGYAMASVILWSNSSSAPSG
ncbi:MAG: holo-ACP synthase [Candidatus Rokuibacteriota bacterium]